MVLSAGTGARVEALFLVVLAVPGALGEVAQVGRADFREPGQAAAVVALQDHPVLADISVPSSLDCCSNPVFK